MSEEEDAESPATVLRLLLPAGGGGAEAVEAVLLPCGAAWCRTAAYGPPGVIPTQEGAALVDAVALRHSLLSRLRFCTPPPPLLYVPPLDAHPPKNRDMFAIANCVLLICTGSATRHFDMIQRHKATVSLHDCRCVFCLL
jgi:hypothetical protein